MKYLFAALRNVAITLCLAVLGTQVWAQTFPLQPVRFISPFPPGSGPDAISRLVGMRLSTQWGQPVVIDPRPGANGFLAIGAVKRAAPTGYDLLLADAGHMAVSPSLFKNLPYAPKADFAPVGALFRNAFFIVVAANSPMRSVKDLVAAAAASPGKITYGSNSVGGPLHLGAAQVETVSGTKMRHIPYKETSQLYLAVSTGEVDWAMGSLASAGSLLQAGKLRLLAVADSARSPAAADVPTFEESSGLKATFPRSWLAVLAPQGTPASVVAFLNRSINDVLKQPDIVERLTIFGFEPYPLTPAGLAALIDSETVFYADIVKRVGVSVE